MMKLKHLFFNTDLSQMLLRNWFADIQDDSPVTPFRTSANAVFTHVNQRQKYFLRFSPVEEKDSTQIRAELAFLQYLYDNQYNAVEAIPALNGESLVVADTPWGVYNAVLFREAKGRQLSAIKEKDKGKLYHGYGEALGRLHRLSMDYTPQAERRLDWSQLLEQSDAMLREYKAPAEVRKELELLKRFFSELPVTKNNYGLIHYDFESDNVFYDRHSRAFCPIDFDDAMYHWFTMDIVKTVQDIGNEQGAQQFLAEYKREMEFDESVYAYAAVFQRYATLYSYARLLRSVHEQWDNEPAWMTELRLKLAVSMNEKSKAFGTEFPA